MTKFILKSRWTKGLTGDSVVCIDYPLPPTDLDSFKHYGGIVVCESMPSSVADHIIQLHNDSLILEVEYESKLESAVSKLTETDRDNICDILWWMKGYKKGAGDSFETCEFHQHHLDTLELMARTMREILNAKKEPD